MIPLHDDAEAELATELSRLAYATAEAELYNVYTDRYVSFVGLKHFWHL